MTTDETAIQETGLQFFGKLSAAVSHDLKNVLSIINEKAGLLEDFCVMARRGGSLDMERIDAITAQVKGQVERADQIIRCFNRFAHSADHPIAVADVSEMAATLVQLAQRLLAALQVSVVVQPADPPVAIATRPLMAQGLIWSGIQWAAARLGDNREITLAVSGTPERASVSIGPVAEVPEKALAQELPAATRAVQAALGAVIQADAGSKMLQIHFTPLEASPDAGGSQ